MSLRDCAWFQVSVGEYVQWFLTFGSAAPSSHQFSVMEVTDDGTDISFKS